MATPPVLAHRALYGSDEPLPARRWLHAGPLSFELVGGRFGPVHVHDHEVWHGMAFLFRDAGWGTPEPVFEKVEHHSDALGFRLDLLGHIPCRSSDVANGPVEGARIDLHLTVQGRNDGQLQFRAQASPTHPLKTNRCGWVLMHPMAAAGSKLEVLHVDGRSSHTTWPQEVPAWPPFMGVRGLRHEYATGHWAEAVLPVEDYETEDQRNNADASFKTYNRSNLMPRPYVLRPGQPLVREMHLRLLGQAPARRVSKAPAQTQLHLQPLAQNAPMPRLGLAITPANSHCIEPWEIDVLRRWRPAQLHMTLWTDKLADDVDWQGVHTLLEASGADLRLDVCAREGLGHGGPQDIALRHLAQQLAAASVVPAAVAALPCGPQTAAWLRVLFPNSAIGGGTPHFFAQLNRLENSGGEDFMAFTVCPTVHGVDEDSIMHGLQSLPSMLETARQRHPERAWHIGPSWLPARASPLGPQPTGQGLQRTALARLDTRTRGLFGAAWLLGHLCAAARAGVQALTLPPLLGDDGLWWAHPDGWCATPAAAMLDTCLRWTHWGPLELRDSEGAPLTWPLAALSGTGPQGQQVLVANLSAEAQTVHWSQGGQWACLDAAAWAQHDSGATHSPWRALGDCPPDLVLGPYALAQIDLSFSPGD